MYLSSLFKNIDWSKSLDGSFNVYSSDVGFLFNDNNVHSYDEIINKAKEQGLSFLPVQLIPSICESYIKDGQVMIGATDRLTLNVEGKGSIVPKTSKDVLINWAGHEGDCRVSSISSGIVPIGKSVWSSNTTFVFIRK